MPVTEQLARALRHHRAGNLADAEGLYREVLRTEPNHPDALHMLGVLARQTGRAELAIDSIAQAMAEETGSPSLFFKLGGAYRQRGNMEQAAAYYERAVKLDAEFAEAHLALGRTLQELGRIDEALASFQRAVELRPHDSQAQRIRGMLWLQTGRWGEGWPAIDEACRLACWESCQFLRQPFWDGSSLAGKTLLIHGQGPLADQLMFASCLPELIEQAERCILLCDPRLKSIFVRSFPRATILADTRETQRLTGDIHTADWQIPLASVCRYLRSDAECFPRHAGYLVANPSLIERWNAVLSKLGDGLKVGIAWRGAATGELNRSTNLDDWAPLFEVSGVQFVGLQSGVRRSEINTVQDRSGVTIHQLRGLHNVDAWESRAALLKALDVVVSVPTDTAHLAGALGVRTLTLLSSWPSWRWMLQGEECPWYPSMTLLRRMGFQPVPAAAFQQFDVVCGRVENPSYGWDSVFQRAAECLAPATSGIAIPANPLPRG